MMRPVSSGNKSGEEGILNSISFTTDALSSAYSHQMLGLIQFSWVSLHVAKWKYMYTIKPPPCWLGLKKGDHYPDVLKPETNLEPE